MSMTRGELRPAFRDPTADEALHNAEELRREYRERARLPASQRYPPPPELAEPAPLEPEGPVWNPPDTYEQGVERMENLKQRSNRYKELIVAEKARPHPDENDLKRMGREQHRVEMRMGPLRAWLKQQAAIHHAERQRIAAENRAVREERVAAILGDESPEGLLASLYFLLDERINSVPEEVRVISERERLVLRRTRLYLRSLGRDPLSDRPLDTDALSLLDIRSADGS